MTGSPLPTDPTVASFQAGYAFPLDPFQLRAIDSVVAGRSVLVAAPTGAGKTVVGEYACHAAAMGYGKCFYTTPIKALSNQKYRDLVERYGEDKVGLLTGDRSVNGDAPVVVMTTEVLRNMIYEASTTLDGLRFVVLDEVHYLGDRNRGAVWEEVIIQVAASVQVVALSATVSNAEEFGDWLHEVREVCDVIIEEHRPVPLRHNYFVNDKLYPTFRAGQKQGASKEHRERAAQALAGIPNPDILMLERNSNVRGRVNKRGEHVRTGPRLKAPLRWQVAEELRQRGWLPAIYFIFSRQGCEDAVEQLVQSGVRLTTPEEREQLQRMAEDAAEGIPSADLEVLGFNAWRAAMMYGVAAHHAGMVPAMKEAVEQAFQAGLLKVVVATETLALGINMPAKCVVIERLEKWDGEKHSLLTPGQYTQLTGRAGRRGLDEVGHAVVLYQRAVDFRDVAGLVGTRTFPLSSQFEPSYNMAVNLLRRHTRSDAEKLLGASFAQFQADRSVAGTGARLVELEKGMDGYEANLACHLGDWPAYWALRRELTVLEKGEAKRQRRARNDAVGDALAALRPGDVIQQAFAPRRGLLAIIALRRTKKGLLLADAVSEDGQFLRVGPRELDGPPEAIGHIRVPDGHPRARPFRDEVASKLKRVEPPVTSRLPKLPDDTRAKATERTAELRGLLRRHACHACADLDDHEVWQRRYDQLADEAGRIRASVSHRTGSLVRQFNRILQVLGDLGYVDDAPAPTEDGLRLAGIYTQADLLVAECLRQGIFDELSTEELAGLCSLFLYEARGSEPTYRAWLPTPTLEAAVAEATQVATELRTRESEAGLKPVGELDAGFVAPAWRWALGRSLDESLGDLELTGGDFVRNAKQVADLLGQIRDISDGELRERAHAAVKLVRRGIVDA